MPQLRDDHQTRQAVKRIFITGISTGVGKTIASAIIAEALQADYWKPVQAGDLDDSDSMKVKGLLSNGSSKIHDNAYALHSPMSPHAAAAIDGIRINPGHINEPETENHLVIEGAGGLLVPLNEQDTILDLIKPDYKVIVVSRHYLGSINHTLLTIECLKQRGLQSFLLFNGDENPATEQIILKMGGVPLLGRIGEEKMFNREIVLAYARELAPALRSL